MHSFTSDWQLSFLNQWKEWPKKFFHDDIERTYQAWGLNLQLSAWLMNIEIDQATMQVSAYQTNMEINQATMQMSACLTNMEVDQATMHSYM